MPRLGQEMTRGIILEWYRKEGDRVDVGEPLFLVDTEKVNIDVDSEIVGLPEKIDPLATEGKAQWVKTFQDFTSTVNSTVNCLFTTFALGAKDYADLLSTVTGWDLSEDGILKIGERIYNLERVIMGRLGFDGKDDTLPSRLLKEPMPEGPAKGHLADLEKMKEEYYKLRGWVNGTPTPEKLKELEIEL